MRATLLMTLVSILVTLAETGGAQISPGLLARPHAELEGAANCTKCHGLRREPVSQMCLACHRDIAWSVEAGRGYHARDAKQQECSKCHPDHAGRDFALISWPDKARDRFDHARAGWPLERSHRDVKCEGCHTAAFRVSPAAALSKRRGTAGWLGLETTCASCHRSDDAHRGALGSKCETCHDAGDWKTASSFDHARTAYPLTGKHAGVLCDKCHLSARLPLKRDAAGERIPLYKPLAFRECSSCHADPHGGRLAGTCSRCHTTRSFQTVERTDFDHALTRYPLTGKHARVSCAACHGEHLARRDPPFATCAGCHTDPHAGQVALGGVPRDCAACHRPDGFAPATYTRAQHAGTRFPLDGKHAMVPCGSCHTTSQAASGAVVRLRMPSARCADCHADAHGAQLATRPNAPVCESCHGVSGWAPSTFSAAAHARLRLPLEGRHAQIACGACHGAARPGLPPLAATVSLGSARVALTIAETECASCHVDPHAGRYATRARQEGVTTCRGCHNAVAWRPSTVDASLHARFSFALDGAHRAVPCVACHEELKTPRAVSTLLLGAKGVSRLPFVRAQARTCASCHQDPHGPQFTPRQGGRCDACHDAVAFAPASRFNHDRDAAFKLSGAHARVACTGCHRREHTGAPNGATRVVYRPVSAKCESCHTVRPPAGARLER